MYGLAKMPPGAAALLYRLASAMDWQLLRTVAEKPGRAGGRVAGLLT